MYLTSIFFLINIQKIFKYNIVKILFGIFIFYLVASVSFYFFERHLQPISYLDSLWWAIVTMSTVGYGDLYPKSNFTRFIISVPTMLIGIGLIGYLTGYIANFMIELTYKKKRGVLKITKKNHLIICNFPGVIKLNNLLIELDSIPLYAKKEKVVVDANLKELPKEVERVRVSFVKGDPLDEQVLIQAGMERRMQLSF